MAAQAATPPPSYLGKRKRSNDDMYGHGVDGPRPKKACHKKLNPTAPRVQKTDTLFEMHRQRSRQDTIEKAECARSRPSLLTHIKDLFQGVNKAFKKVLRSCRLCAKSVCWTCTTRHASRASRLVPPHITRKRRVEDEVVIKVRKKQKTTHVLDTSPPVASSNTNTAEIVNEMEVEKTELADTILDLEMPDDHVGAPLTTQTNHPQPMIEKMNAVPKIDIGVTADVEMAGAAKPAFPTNHLQRTPVGQSRPFSFEPVSQPPSAPVKQDFAASKFAPFGPARDGDLDMEEVNTPSKPASSNIPGLSYHDTAMAKTVPTNTGAPSTQDVPKQFNIPVQPPLSAKNSVKQNKPINTVTAVSTGSANMESLPTQGAPMHFTILVQPPSSAKNSGRQRQPINKGQSEMMKSKFATSNQDEASQEYKGTQGAVAPSTTQPGAATAVSNQQFTAESAKLDSVMHNQSETTTGCRLYPPSTSVFQYPTAEGGRKTSGTFEVVDTPKVENTSNAFSNTLTQDIDMSEKKSAAIESNSVASYTRTDESAQETQHSPSSTAPTTDDGMITFDDDDNDPFLCDDDDGLDVTKVFFGRRTEAYSQEAFHDGSASSPNVLLGSTPLSLQAHLAENNTTAMHVENDQSPDMSFDGFRAALHTLGEKVHTMPKSLHSFLNALLATTKDLSVSKFDLNQENTNCDTVREAIVSGTLWNLCPVAKNYQGDGSTTFRSKMKQLITTRTRFQALIRAILNMGYSLEQIVKKSPVQDVKDVVDTFVIDNKYLDDCGRDLAKFPEPLAGLEGRDKECVETVLQHWQDSNSNASIKDIQDFVKADLPKIVTPTEQKELFTSILKNAGYCKKGQWKTLDRLRATLMGDIDASAAFGKLSDESWKALVYRLEQMYPRSMKFGFEASGTSYPLEVTKIVLDGSWEEDAAMMPQASASLNLSATEDITAAQDNGIAPPSTDADDFLSSATLKWNTTEQCD